MTFNLHSQGYNSITADRLILERLFTNDAMIELERICEYLLEGFIHMVITNQTIFER